MLKISDHPVTPFLRKLIVKLHLKNARDVVRDHASTIDKLIAVRSDVIVELNTISASSNEPQVYLGNWIRYKTGSQLRLGRDGQS